MLKSSIFLDNCFQYKKIVCYLGFNLMKYTPICTHIRSNHSYYIFFTSIPTYFNLTFDLKYFVNQLHFNVFTIIFLSLTVSVKIV